MDIGWVNIKAPPYYRLDVEVIGEGTVVSSPPGIDCPGYCTAIYTPGTSVTLTATPAIGRIFDGWGGACTGTGTCTLIMTEDMMVQASFSSPTAYYLFDAAGLQHGAQGGRAGVDELCQNNADMPAVCTIAWGFVSVNTHDEIRDMPATKGVDTSRPWYFRDGDHPGVLAANNWADLLDGSVLNRSWDGRVDGAPWTGSKWDGSVRPNMTCEGWTAIREAAFIYRGQVGSEIFVDGRWLSNFARLCNWPHGRFFCACY